MHGTWCLIWTHDQRLLMLRMEGMRLLMVGRLLLLLRMNGMRV